MKKIKVYSSQFNYQYGTSIHFPYSIASLFAYVNSFPKLKKRFQYETTFIFRNKMFKDFITIFFRKINSS